VALKVYPAFSGASDCVVLTRVDYIETLHMK